MWNKPTKERLAKIPNIYETEEIPVQDKVIHLKFFIGNCTWYISEYDGQDTFFGLVIGHEKELGYFSLSELKQVKGPLGLHVERDLYFKPKTLKEIAPEMFVPESKR